ncbi:tRNA dimethylallyltransferase [Leptospira ryugenii]|uniref:tRNA dimethylallyltransferase n=1 Tax=Leptospira ryugenii TaxID=1917863 RepID=A0A2P2E0G8_9LEPT|nr:tRNA (adenosine(37)-N6)-dimethylallyltransferase MiaA [Leptospira ryugenii]GBF50306.1 tRNA dimethylallyltransferase [Leptospira ryugenii]
MYRLQKQMLVLAGPTGSGKTSLVCSLNPQIFEVVSFDSRQIYQELSIGTTCPTEDELVQMPHHLVQCIPPTDTMNAGDYSILAKKAVQTIFDKGKIPILVTGSGFYLRAFLQGMFPVPKIPEETKEIAKNMDYAEAIHYLREKDPIALSEIQTSDHYRLKRILEVVLTGARWSEVSKQTVGGFLEENPGLKIQGYWLDWPREELYRRIGKRVLGIYEGMLDETMRVAEQFGADCPGLRSLGYNFALDFLQGAIDTNAFIESLAQAHRNYAKRQITWFRKDPLLQANRWEDVFSEWKNIEKI